MLGYIGRRLVEAIPIWLAITLIVFILMNIIPGDPVAQLMDSRAGALDADVVEEIREEWGLNDPLPIQYLSFLQGAIVLDFGTSFQTRSGVTELLIERIPVTINVTLLALLFAIVFGVTIGVFAAYRRGTWLDSFVSSLSISGVSIPSFFLGLMLMYVFSVHFKLLPSSGYQAGDIRYLILPAITLGMAVSGVIARITRSSMIDILKMDYITTAYSKGISSWRISIIHGLKNALPPIMTIIGVQMGLLLSGAVITETIFGLPGIGRLLIDSIMQRDIPTVQGCVVFVATVFLVVNLLADIVNRWIDPRIATEAKS